MMSEMAAGYLNVHRSCAVFNLKIYRNIDKVHESKLLQSGIGYILYKIGVLKMT
jgi:hypothetical protein